MRYCVQPDEPVGKTYIRKLITQEQRNGNSTPYTVVRVHLGMDRWLMIREDGKYFIDDDHWGWNDTWEEL